MSEHGFLPARLSLLARSAICYMERPHPLATEVLYANPEHIKHWVLRGCGIELVLSAVSI